MHFMQGPREEQMRSEIGLEGQKKMEKPDESKADAEVQVEGSISGGEDKSVDLRVLVANGQKPSAMMFGVGFRVTARGKVDQPGAGGALTRTQCQSIGRGSAVSGKLQRRVLLEWSDPVCDRVLHEQGNFLSEPSECDGAPVSWHQQRGTKPGTWCIWRSLTLKDKHHCCPILSIRGEVPRHTD